MEPCLRLSLFLLCREGVGDLGNGCREGRVRFGGLGLWNWLR